MQGVAWAIAALTCTSRVGWAAPTILRHANVFPIADATIFARHVFVRLHIGPPVLNDPLSELVGRAQWP